MPALTVTISVAGKQGQTSSLPFGVRDEQVGIAQPDRPVWVLAQTYPRLPNSDEPGGATTLQPQDLRLRPAEAWRDDGGDLEAERGQGRPLHPPLQRRRRAERNGEGGDQGGVAPGGSFVTEISAVPPDTEVTDSGEVVEARKQRQRSKPGE